MAKHTVTEFGIEVQFSEKVLTGLTKLESQVMKAAVKMEKSLNDAFAKDHTKPLADKIKNLETLTRNVAQSMNRSLNAAFDAKVNSRRMFGGVITDANRAAKEANRILNGIGNGLRVGGRPAHGGNGNNGNNSGGRPPRFPRGEGIPEGQRLANRFNNSAQMQRLQFGGGQSSVFAREMQSRAAMAQVRFAGDTQNLRREFARLSAMVREHEAAVRRDTQATREEARARAAAERAEQRAAGRASRTSGGGMRGGAGSGSAKATMLGMLGANAVTMAIGTAVKVAKEAYEQGAERSQAKTMMGSAFGANAEQMQKQAAEMSNKYGMNQTETMRELSILRNTMPSETFSNKDLLSHFENMNVFAHATGVKQDAVGRANYAISQIAGSAKINKQDINQLTGAVPEALKITAKEMGISKTQLIAQLKDIKPEVFLKKFEDGMKHFNETTGASEKAMNSVQAAQGRMSNAWNNDLIALFDGTGATAGDWFNRITQALIYMQPVFKAAGENIKAMSDAVVVVIGVIKSMKQAWDDWVKSFSPESFKALDILKTGFIDFFKWMGQAFIDVFTDLFESVKKLFSWFDSVTGGDSKEPTSKKYGENIPAGGVAEKFLDWLNSRNEEHAKIANSATPMFDNMKSNAGGLSGAEDYGYKNGNYDLKQKAQLAGDRFDLGSQKVDVSLKPTPLNGDVTVTVNFDEGSLNRAIAKVSGQAISDNSESQHVNVGTMGGGWSGAQNNAGWKSGNYNLSY